jgi:type IV pilus assembly protein PilW
MTALDMKSKFQTGMTLIELMVALAIGMFLMIGAMTVFMQGRTTFRITESISRLQENGRFALDALEQDVRMAQYWGLTNRSEAIRGRATEAPIPTAGALAACGANWVIDLDNAIAATNNGYAWGCAGNNVDTGANGSDSFVVRRVAENALTPAQVNAITAATPGMLFVQSSRGGTLDGQIFSSPVPAGYDPATDELHQLVVNGYYVSTRSATTFAGANVPSLRMRTLVAGVAGVELQDRELIPGVEDMQLQFGIDTDPPTGPNRGSIDRYVNPGDPLLATSIILAVRVWLRIRAERIENGFVDNTTYNYANENATYNDNFRRVVVSKTIYLRNARQ